MKILMKIQRMIMRSNNLIIYLLGLTLISCSQNLDVKMLNLVENQYNKDSCNVNFAKIIDEPWDYLYIVEEFITPSEISNELGFRYYGEMVSDGEYRIIITKNKKVIRESSFYSSRIIFKQKNIKGITKVSIKDTFCAEYNTKVSPSFYFLKK